MAFNLQKTAFEFMGKLAPKSDKAGNILLAINAMGMAFAALSNTYAAAVDKNTSKEDKKFLIPAGLVTGVANIGAYFAITNKIIDKLKKSADKIIGDMEKNNPAKLQEKAFNLVENQIAKVAKKDKALAQSMEDTFKNNGEIIKDKAIDFYKDNTKAALGVTGAFAGAIIGSAILTPIIRDISAYFVQKRMEKKNPELKEQPYKPYFEPTRIESVRYGHYVKKQPLSMKNYMAFANSGSMKV